MIRSSLLVSKHTPLASHGLVVAEHPRGAEVGAAVLARGGNAVDAAVATAFAMTVVEPFMSTIAGSGTMVVHLARSAETHVVDFNACAPLAAHEGMYRLVGGTVQALFTWPRVEGDANLYGHRSVAVPGSIAGLTLALARFGTMELRDVVAPAIELAEGGFVHDWYQALMTAKSIEELSAYPASAAAYLRNGRSIYRPPSLDSPGDHAVYRDLAASLRQIARDGADAFYRGALGQAMVDHLHANGGLMTREDLAAYRAHVVAPLTARYRDLDLALSPGATGGVTALEILNILAHFPPAQVGWQSVGGLHRRAQASGRAFADRFAYLGDPAQTKAPWDRLVSKAYAKEIAAELGRAGGDAGARRGRPAAGSVGADECTTHVGVVDRRRNMVALTHTAVSLFGSRVVVPGTGILLNNAMIWFDPEPAKPNSVGPGKRALVNMVPALAFRRGAPYLSLGAPGGRRIISAIAQVVANLADGKGDLQAAIEAPRLHVEQDELLIDDRVGHRVLAGLERLGHRVTPKAESYSGVSFARPVGIRITKKGLEAGLDQMGTAAAAGI
jgi:gamma-glutamyltranspeptidase/glutathione hydrolase